jgi:thiol-disulfide isomerase/thioredoxin
MDMNMTRLFTLLFFALLISCSSNNDIETFKPEKVIISGKVLNFNHENKELVLFLQNVGFSGKEILLELDSIGNFKTSFITYLPTTVQLRYRQSDFKVLVHPKDSIYVEFDGRKQDFLETIKFSGDAVKINLDVAAFQRKYKLSKFFNWDYCLDAAKEYDTKQFLLYLDSMKLDGENIYKQFVSDNTPTEETKIWAASEIDGHVYANLTFYPVRHRSLNNIKETEWDVPVSYYNLTKEILPIKESMLINSFSMNDLITAHVIYAWKNYYKEKKLLSEKQQTIRNSKNLDEKSSSEPWLFDGLIKFTPDSLMLQLVIIKHLVDVLEAWDIDLFERNRSIIDKYITRAYLKEPLFELYNQVKQKVGNPQIAPDVILKKSENSSIKQIIDSVFINNKGKIIYLDCWATWCAPCREEMPNSKNLMKELKGHNVSFVYFCIDSDEKSWKAALAEFQLGGEHYFLNKEQSAEFRNVFEVNGVPFYILIDKKGNIIEKGSHLRPENVKEKITTLF